MIPLKLTIKGLYSYQQETVIDFTRLISAGLFGIFGAVGSGKSSILEAITFALYGETERLNNRDSRSYNMMNLKSNEMLIDFEFSSGALHTQYRFAVSCKRNKKRFTETSAFERKTYEWIKDSWQPTAKTAIEILGLSYENFKRTIIIPQGRFQEFLQLKETDRVQMLKEIFNLEKFELAPKVAALAKDNDLKISNTQGQMQNLPEYDEVTLQQKQEVIFAQQKILEKQSVELKLHQQQEKEYDMVKQQFAELELRTAAHQQLQQQEPSFVALEKEINEYEHCEKTFKHLFDNRNKLAAHIAQQQQNFAQQKMQAAETAMAIKQSEEFLQSLGESYRNKEVLLQRAGELEKIIAIQALDSSISELGKRIEKGQQMIAEKEVAKEAQNAALAALLQTIDSKQEALSDTSMLIRLNDWFGRRSQLAGEVINAEKEMHKAGEKHSDASNAVIAKLKMTGKEMIFEGMPENMEAINEKAKDFMDAADVELQAFKEDWDQLQLSQKLQAFASNLHEGMPCPLCGSLHHPQVLSMEETDEKAHLLKKKIKVIENAQSNLQEVLIALSGLYADYENSKKQSAEKINQLTARKTALEMHESTFDFEGYSQKDEVVVKNQLQAVEAQTKELAAFRKQTQTIQQEIEEAGKAIQKYKAAIDELSKESASKIGEEKALKSQVLLCKTEEEINKDKLVLLQTIAALQADYISISQRYETSAKVLQQKQQESGALQGKLEEMGKQFSQSNETLKEYKDQIAALLLQNHFASEEAVIGILQKTFDATIEREKMNSYWQQLHAASVQLQEAVAKTKDKVYNEQAHYELLHSIDMLTTQQKELAALITTLAHDIANLQKQMTERKLLQAELDKLTERATNLATLSRLFKAAGFVNYVSAVYLQNLVNAANKRFYKMTRQQLLLELNEDNAFQVRDFMNNGEVRSIKTLSGGQTFQAALSLALALADNIQHLVKSAENFFFLDEGFGSLDKDALAIVFETLQGLKKENRIVGIISHVEEMQQEVEVNLRIENDILCGSTIKESWR